MTAKAAAAAPTTTLEGVLAELESRFTGTRLRDAQRLARAFFRRVPAEDLAARGSGAWAGLLAGVHGLIQVRLRDAANVQVYNPTQEEHGWDSAATVIQIVTDDSPFLVDSVGIAIAQCGTLVQSVVHPVVQAERDAGGHLLQLADDGARGRAESVMHFEVERQAEPGELLRLKQAIEAALADVRACVRDWAPMRDQAQAIADDLATRQLPLDAAGRAEAQEFLRWIADDHFTFLGYREYEVARNGGEDVLRAVPGSGLGILAGTDSAPPRPLKSLAARDLPQSGAIDAIILTKTNSRSTVHRPGYMDYLSVLKFNASGRPVGEQRFLGLFTSSAYARRPWDIPLVRVKHDAVMQGSGLKPEGHSGKALRNILETLPRDELFQASAEELAEIAQGVLALQQRHRTRLFVRRDRYGRFWSCLVYLPRDRVNAEVRERVEALLKRAFHG